MRSTVSLLLTFLALAAPAAAQTGGVNTGLPGSTCAATTGGYVYSPPGAGVTPDALAGAPAAHEVGEPTDGGPAKGVMIVLHGGGWHVVGRQMLVHQRPNADRWRARGWRTVNSTYGACASSITDVVALYDLVRAEYPGLPVCAGGASAGGHLALMLGARRPGLDCAISNAGPTDPGALAAQRAASSYWQAVAAFGLDGLSAASPLAQIGLLRTRVLIAAATNDAAMPLKQAVSFDAAFAPLHYADLVTLDPGTEQWVHSQVSSDSRQSLYRREQNLVAPLVGEPRAECDICGAGASWSRTQTAASSVVMSNRILHGATQVGTLNATLKLSATGATWTMPATTVQLPAGRHVLQTCFGALGSVVTAFDKCLDKEVTLGAAGSATTPVKTLGLARLVLPYQVYAAVFVKTYANGAWTATAGSWSGNHASRITVPPLAAAM